MKEITWSDVFTQIDMLIQDMRHREVTQDEFKQLVKIATAIPMVRPVLLHLFQKHDWSEEQVAEIIAGRFDYVYNPDLDLSVYRVDVGLTRRDGNIVMLVGEKEYQMGETIFDDIPFIQLTAYGAALECGSHSCTLPDAKFAECDRVVKWRVSHFDLLAQKLYLTGNESAEFKAAEHGLETPPQKHYLEKRDDQ